jgi:hypothetical protein
MKSLPTIKIVNKREDFIRGYLENKPKLEDHKNILYIDEIYDSLKVNKSESKDSFVEECQKELDTFINNNPNDIITVTIGKKE